jgi:hypothetical protein
MNNSITKIYKAISRLTQIFWLRRGKLLETDLKVKSLNSSQTQEITIKRLSRDYRH